MRGLFWDFRRPKGRLISQNFQNLLFPSQRRTNYFAHWKIWDPTTKIVKSWAACKPYYGCNWYNLLQSKIEWEIITNARRYFWNILFCSTILSRSVATKSSKVKSYKFIKWLNIYSNLWSTLFVPKGSKKIKRIFCILCIKLLERSKSRM